MVFFIFFEFKTNILFYRRVQKSFEVDCLLYLGYEDGKAVHGALNNRSVEDAITIRKNLIQLHSARNVCLCLDGFIYKDVPRFLQAYILMGTSQLLGIKSHEEETTKIYLLPSWSKKDLFLLGKEIYSFTTDDMEDRYAISGSSVRDFTKATLKEIREAKVLALRAVPKRQTIMLLISMLVLAKTKLIVSVVHTFVT
uniref:Crinkler (CRN) family protein putative n=1 Tax=Albugo laibachii Nc14 TaxID=890382 RepID=F0WZK9_9STRA|nr:Crinkler (CRN) family protein putative [Albugo laibachii Nc14]|eukprot:CCA26933.1 Crinkler (CRN) family protein putative [Albugo laibachii Nc14]